jgi:hypothetical protein
MPCSYVVIHARAQSAARRNLVTAWFGGLSARRRIFTAGLGLLAASTAVVVAAAIAARAGHGTPGGYPAQNRPGPVLLVPGYGGSTRALSVLVSRIRATGRRATVVRLPGNGTGSLIVGADIKGYWRWVWFIAGLEALATAPILMICRGSWRRFTLPKCACWRAPMSLSASFPNGISGGRLTPEREPCW